MGSSENPKRQANKFLVPVIASSSSELLPGARLFASIDAVAFGETPSVEISSAKDWICIYSNSVTGFLNSVDTQTERLLSDDGRIPV
ncbi:hypothetical protein SprV_0100222000 [Sparganum proliferum]